MKRAHRLGYTDAPVTNLRALLRTITYPARRHRCMGCRGVFECHLCPIDGHEHPLHRSDWVDPVVVVCPLCASRLRLDSVLARGREDVRVWRIYDYQTGQIEWEYRGRLLGTRSARGGDIGNFKRPFRERNMK